MPASDVQIKKIPVVRVAELVALAPDFGPESIGPVAGPLFSDLAGRINAAGAAMTGGTRSEKGGGDGRATGNRPAH